MEGHKTQQISSATHATPEQGALKGVIIFACMIVALGAVMIGPISQSGIKGAREPGYVVLTVGVVVLALALLSRRMSPRGRLLLSACGAFVTAAAAAAGLAAYSWLYFSQGNQDVSSSAAAGESASQAFGYFTVAGLLILIAISGAGTGTVLLSRFRRSREL